MGQFNIQSKASSKASLRLIQSQVYCTVISTLVQFKLQSTGLIQNLLYFTIPNGSLFLNILLNTYCTDNQPYLSVPLWGTLCLLYRLWCPLLEPSVCCIGCGAPGWKMLLFRRPTRAYRLMVSAPLYQGMSEPVVLEEQIPGSDPSQVQGEDIYTRV